MNNTAATLERTVSEVIAAADRLGTASVQISTASQATSQARRPRRTRARRAGAGRYLSCTLADDDLEPPPDGAGTRSEFLAGTARCDGRFLVVLGIGAVVGSVASSPGDPRG